MGGNYGGLDIGVHNNTLVNGLRGLLERVLMYRRPDGGLEPLPSVTADWKSRLEPFRAQYSREVRVGSPWTVQEFLDTYSGRQRTLYETAASSLATSPLLPIDARVGPSFVKAEKINHTSKNDPASRIIQPRTPRYNLEVGVFLKKIEKKVYHHIQSLFKGPTVMKGRTPHGVAQDLHEMWNDFQNPVAVGLDASRFDQHVRPELLQFEHMIYLMHFAGSDRKRLKRLLSWQINNQGLLRCSDGSVKYKVKGARMSGDMNTSLGNCLIMCALVWTFLVERGVAARLANNGDDCILILESRDLPKISGLNDWFLEFGLRMKQEEPVSVFEQIEFCQSHPVNDGHRYVMVRNVHSALSKDGVALDQAYGHGIGLRKWAWAVGECGLALAGGMPVYDAFYRMYMRHGLPSNVVESTGFKSGLYYMSRGMHRVSAPPTDTARVSFWEAFGMTPTMQVALEREYDNATWEVTPTPGKLFPPHSTDRGVVFEY